MVTSLCKGACREREATSVIRNRRQTCSRSPPNPRSAHMRSCPLPDHRSHGQPVTGSARRRQTRAIRVPVQRRRPAVGQRSAATSPATSAEQVPGVLPCQQIPAVPVTGSGRRHRARQSTSGHPGATGHDRDRHQPADSFPAARVTGCRLGSPAGTGRHLLSTSERQNARIWAAPITAPRVRDVTLAGRWRCELSALSGVVGAGRACR